jgi:predicted NUDIX family NTP pyrophosphohydrolase
MPTLALFRWQGDAYPFVAAYNREMTDAPAVTLDQPRRRLHVFAHGKSGAVVVDLWESEDDFRRMFDAAEFKRNVAASDWPSRPQVEVYQVHATIL